MLKLLFVVNCLFLINFAFSQRCDVIDTISTSGKSTFFKTISKKEYLSKKDSSLPLTNENALKKTNGFYSLNLNERVIVLRDTLEEDNPLYAHYEYVGVYPNIGLLYFSVSYYESGATLLINQHTGNSVEFFGEPILSPNGTLMFNASQIMNYDVIPNIIQIWSIENGQIKLLIEYDLDDDWIPENIKWIDEKTIFFIRKFEDNSTVYAMIDVMDLLR